MAVAQAISVGGTSPDVLDYRVIVGDNRQTLRDLPDRSVHMVATSPPYWGLRDYGHDDQIGLEQSPAEYVATLVEVFREVRRVLRDDGTLWLNLGDSYANDGKWGGSTGGKHASALHGATGVGRQKTSTGLKPKDLVGIPWRVAFALQDDEWYLRQDIIWAKPNPMPESVQDRCTKAHEYVFLLTKSPRYYYDAEAVKEAASTSGAGGVCNKSTSKRAGTGLQSDRDYKPDGFRNRRSVWQIATAPCKEAHFATWPPETRRTYDPGGHERARVLRDLRGSVGADRRAQGNDAQPLGANARKRANANQRNDGRTAFRENNRMAPLLQLRRRASPLRRARSVWRLRHNGRRRQRARPQGDSLRTESGLCGDRAEARRGGDRGYETQSKAEEKAAEGRVDSTAISVLARTRTGTPGRHDADFEGAD